MAYFPIIPAACMSLIFSKIAFTVFALCQIVNHFGPPAKFYGPAATRWSDPAGRRLRLDHRKRSDVLRLRVEGSVAEKPSPPWLIGVGFSATLPSTRRRRTSDRFL